MKNLEQLRAASALKYAETGSEFGGQEGGEVVKKLPAMIMTNGLLASAAFAGDKGKGWSTCFNFLAQHLSHPEIGILEEKVKDLSSLLRELAAQDSATLKLATSEALAWLSYASRFVKASSKGATNDSDDE